MTTDQASSNLSSHLVAETTRMTLAVREDLAVHARRTNGILEYLVSDPASSRFFRIGPTQYEFLTLLDGSRTIAEAIAEQGVHSCDALTENDASAFSKWLIDEQLATNTASRSASRRIKQKNRRRYITWWQKSNPLVQQIALGCPNRLFQRLRPLAQLLFCKVSLIVWSVLIVVGAVTALNHTEGLLTTGSAIIDHRQWVRLLLLSLALKLIHECAHALACVRYGGRLGPAGILLFMFVPLPFVDVTQAWALPQRRLRILVAAAGMMAELAIASIAAIVYAGSTSPTVQSDAAMLFWMASLVTVLFNANPLMRFDGYFILSDWLHLPNLANHGALLTQHRFHRLVGLPEAIPETTTPRAIAAIYGAAAFVWRITLCFGIAYVASQWFHGLGMLLAASALIAWYGPGLWQLGYRVAESRLWKFRAFWYRMLCVTSLLLAAGYAVLQLRPLTVPVLFDFTDIRTIQPLSSGFLVQTFAKEGDVVAKGALLARLENRELGVERQAVLTQIERSRLLINHYIHTQHDGQRSAEQAKLEGLEKCLRELDMRKESLEIRAPIEGLITRCHLENRGGCYVRCGEPTFEIAALDSFCAIALVDQKHAGRMGQLGDESSPYPKHWKVRLAGSSRSDWLTFRQAYPHATTRVDYPALTAIAQGQIAIRELQPAEELPTHSKWSLATPHVELRFDCPEALRTLHPGSAGTARASLW